MKGISPLIPLFRVLCDRDMELHEQVRWIPPVRELSPQSGRDSLDCAGRFCDLDLACVGTYRVLEPEDGRQIETSVVSSTQ
jgi:hypothetical protein